MFLYNDLQADQGDSEQQIALNRVIVAELGATLMSRLQIAIEEGGYVNALKTCQIIAPEIGDDLSTRYAMEVGRTSLKTRNPQNNPEPWQKDVLEIFEQRHRSGEEIAKLEYYEETESNGRQIFRYMKAIPTSELCLTCHGKHISNEIISILHERYPEDRARGFEAGDIRGAFTITNH